MAEVDHVVLFKAKPGMSSPKIGSLIAEFRALRNLEGIHQFHVGPLLRLHSDGWTFALHARYRDRQALEAYAVHPEHLQVVAHGDNVLDDKLALDWEIHSSAEASRFESDFIRFIAIAFKDNVPQEKIEDLSLGLRNFPAIIHASSGLNFSPRSKGFGWGFVAQFASLQDLEDLKIREEQEELLQSPVVAGFTVVDFNSAASGVTAKI